MFQVPAETLLRVGRQGGEGFVAFQRLLLRFDWERRHSEEDSLPHSLGTVPARLLEKIGAALDRLRIEIGQPLAETLLRRGRHSPKEWVFLKSARLLVGRQGGDAQKEIAHQRFAHGAAVVAHLLPGTIRTGRGR